MKDTLHYPPPWDLRGEGLIIPFLGNKQELLKSGFIQEEDKASFRGGLGACMLVNYETSNVGQYFELLFIPGDFEYKGRSSKKLYKKITKIYVSSELSIREGRLNWAIPKEFANFTWTKEKNTTKVTVKTKEGKDFFETEFTERFISFPVTTKLYPVSLLQKSEDAKLINTRFSGYGKAKIAKVSKRTTSDEKLFVNIEKISQYSLGLAISEFNIIFPIPEIF